MLCHTTSCGYGGKVPKKLYMVTYTGSGGSYRKHWLVKANASNEAMLLVALFENNLSANALQYQAKPVEFNGAVAELLEEMPG